MFIPIQLSVSLNYKKIRAKVVGIAMFCAFFFSKPEQGQPRSMDFYQQHEMYMWEGIENRDEEERKKGEY